MGWKTKDCDAEENEGEAGGGAAQCCWRPALLVCEGEKMCLLLFGVLLSSRGSKVSKKNREVPNLTRSTMCVFMKSERAAVGGCSTFLCRGWIPDPDLMVSTGIRRESNKYFETRFRPIFFKGRGLKSIDCHKSLCFQHGSVWLIHLQWNSPILFVCMQHCDLLHRFRCHQRGALQSPLVRLAHKTFKICS